MSWLLKGNSHTDPAEHFVGTKDDQPLVIRTNEVEAARVDVKGNLGVGTTTPQNKLHVGPGSSAIAAGRVNAVVASDTVDGGVAIAQKDGVNLLLQASGTGGFIGTTSNHPLILRTNDQDRVVIRTDGDVQVGPGVTSIAASRVNAVLATTEVDAGLAIAQNSGVNVLVQASGAGGFMGTTSNHPLILRTNDQDRVVVRTNGDVQVGAGTTSIAASRVNAVFATTEVDAGIAIAQNSGVNLLVQASGAGGFIGTTSNHPLVFRTNDQDRVTIDTSGNLRVAGDVILTNADCAEDFDVAASAVVDPGTVMVLGAEGKLEHSQRAYDRRVAGVISGAGSYRPAIVLDRQEPCSDRKAIALVGKVYCKVDATDAPIEIGDLLTTSARPGHAMKATDPLKAFGAVIGKALRRHDAGQGLIPVLIALQ
jgi:hypothetical protein